MASWVPDITDGPLNGAKEMPPDGVTTIGFTHEVDAHLLAGPSAGISLRDADGNELPAGSPAVEVVSCSRAWDLKCVSLRLTGPTLELDTKYTVVIAAGTRCKRPVNPHTH